MTLDDRLKTLLEPLGAVPKRMFSGTGFMLNGNLLLGTHKGGLIVRVGPDAQAAAVKRQGAKAMEMGGRQMNGWVVVDALGANTETQLRRWIDMAPAFNKTLPPDAAKKKSAKKPAKAKR